MILNQSLDSNAHAQLAAIAAGATRPSKAMVLHIVRPLIMYHSAGFITQPFQSIRVVYDKVFKLISSVYKKVQK